MSIITNGEAGESLSSGNTNNSNNSGREDHQRQSFQIDSVNSLSSATTLSNGSTTQLHPLIKKKRNPPGNPDPSAEVVALSPNTLVAKNRFVCEICSKGFQRDQNLQLHRRGHNLPWKLRQRNASEAAKKRVYVCPEESCVHHNPSRALGDLTGIKKHFSRKHGLKKWKCHRCAKNYAVHSDFKAHSKTCGTRQYNCECGTIFSRRDSFITHRAFCDAIAGETSKTTLTAQMPSFERHENVTLTPHRSELISSLVNTTTNAPQPTTGNDNTFTAIIDNSKYATSSRDHHQQDLMMTHDAPAIQNHNPLIMMVNSNNQYQNGTTCPYMSATALLQKAAQMGSTSTAGGLAKGSVMAPPSYSSAHHRSVTMISANNNGNNNNNVGFMGGVFFGHGRQNHAGDKNDVVLHAGNSGGGNVMTTVDFLGVGRSAVNNNVHQQNSKGFDHDQVLMFDDDQSENLQGLSHFEQNHVWEV